MNKKELRSEYDRIKGLLRIHSDLEKGGFSLEICEEHTWETINAATILRHGDFVAIKEHIEGIKVRQICKTCGVEKDVIYTATKEEEVISDFKFKLIRGEEE